MKFRAALVWVVFSVGCTVSVKGQHDGGADADAAGVETDLASAPDLGPSGQVCPSATPMRCGDGCYDVQTEDAHCGACGTVCAAGSHCAAGVCRAGGIELLAGTYGGVGTVDGIGTDARLYSPYNIGSDGSTALYVSDGNVIRKVVVATKLVSHFAGADDAGFADGLGGAARFSKPSGIAVIGDIVYVADLRNCAVRAITPAGSVSTLVGVSGECDSIDGVGAVARLNFPQGLTTDGTDLFVADSIGNRIRRIEIATTAVTTIAGSGVAGTADGIGTAATFNLPFGVVWSAGNLYVSDGFGHRIRKISLTDNTVTTLAGSTQGNLDGTGTAAQFSVPAAITTDAAGDLLVVDSGNGLIRTVTVGGGVVGTAPNSFAFIDSRDATLGGGLTRVGNTLYVAHYGAQNVVAVDTTSWAAEDFVGGVAVGGNEDGTGAAARFQNPTGIAYDSTADALYVADQDNFSVRRIAVATGAVSTVAGDNNTAGIDDGVGTAAHFLRPTRLAFANGKLLITDGPALRSFDPTTGAVTTVAGSATVGSTDGTGTAASFARLDGITLVAADTVWVADASNATLRSVVISTGVVTTVAGVANDLGITDGIGAAARFVTPTDVAFVGPDSVYVTDSEAGTLRRVTVSTGAVLTVAGAAFVVGDFDGIGTEGTFAVPGALLEDAGGVLISDSENALLRRFAPSTGLVTTYAGTRHRFGVKPGPLPGSFDGPRGLARMPGAIAFTDSQAVFILRE